LTMGVPVCHKGGLLPHKGNFSGPLIESQPSEARAGKDGRAEGGGVFRGPEARARGCFSGIGFGPVFFQMFFFGESPSRVFFFARWCPGSSAFLGEPGEIFRGPGLDSWDSMPFGNLVLRGPIAACSFRAINPLPQGLNYRGVTELGGERPGERARGSYGPRCWRDLSSVSSGRRACPVLRFAGPEPAGFRRRCCPLGSFREFFSVVYGASYCAETERSLVPVSFIELGACFRWNDERRLHTLYFTICASWPPSRAQCHDFFHPPFLGVTVLRCRCARRGCPGPSPFLSSGLLHLPPSLWRKSWAWRVIGDTLGSRTILFLNV